MESSQKFFWLNTESFQIICNKYSVSLSSHIDLQILIKKTEHTQFVSKGFSVEVYIFIFSAFSSIELIMHPPRGLKGPDIAPVGATRGLHLYFLLVLYTSYVWLLSNEHYYKVQIVRVIW